MVYCVVFQVKSRLPPVGNSRRVARNNLFISKQNQTQLFSECSSKMRVTGIETKRWHNARGAGGPKGGHTQYRQLFQLAGLRRILPLLLELHCRTLALPLTCRGIEWPSCHSGSFLSRMWGWTGLLYNHRDLDSNSGSTTHLPRSPLGSLSSSSHHTRWG